MKSQKLNELKLAGWGMMRIKSRWTWKVMARSVAESVVVEVMKVRDEVGNSTSPTILEFLSSIISRPLQPFSKCLTLLADF